MSLVNLDLDMRGLDALIIELNGTQKQVDRALSSASTKMAAWIRTRSARGLSAHLKLQQKIIRRRLKSFRAVKTADGYQIKVWYGLDPVALIHMGARKTKTGVTASGHKRDGAFIASGKGGRQVFKRRGSGRLPIEKQTLNIGDTGHEYLEKMADSAQFTEQFFKFFEHELKWRTQTQK